MLSLQPLPSKVTPSQETRESKTVAICISTCRRPEGLRALLEGIDRLEFEQVPTPHITLVVIDNDAEGRAAYQLCEQLQGQLCWPLRYGLEAQRGISYARNATIALAPDDVDFIVMIDDDEVPEPLWLDHLLATQRNTNADVVHGPVLPNFPEDVDDWLVEGNFFQRRRYPTGSATEYAYAGNVLVRTELLKSLPNAFDERLALTGGEDSHLFRNLCQQGHQIVWSDEAVAYESIPHSRLNASWIIKRGYRGCLTYSQWQQEHANSWITKPKIFLKGLAYVGVGAMQFVAACGRGQGDRLKARVKMAQGAGCLASLMGVTYQEYKVIHSS